MNDVHKLDFKFDVKKLNESLDWILEQADIDRVNQLCLTHARSATPHPDGKWYQGAGSLFYEYKAGKNGIERIQREPMLFEDQFNDFIDEAKHTYFYDVYKHLNTEFDIGRVRIIKIHSCHCLTWHQDVDKRIHVPIVTNEGNRLVIGDSCYHLPGDGSAYYVNTTKPHTAFNGGTEHRYNLLCTVRN